MTIQISLPIDTPGYDYLTQWRIAKKYQRLFEADGHRVINPFEVADNLNRNWQHSSPPTRRDYLNRDLENIPHCTHIFMCNGWTGSQGCIEEAEEATFFNVTFLYERNYDIQSSRPKRLRAIQKAMQLLG